METKLIPYLNFDGQTAEAMKFYQSIFGGDLKMQTFSEFGAPVKEEEKDLIMHSSLENGELSFMAADGTSEHPVHMGDNINMSLGGGGKAKLTEYFNKLAEGGKVTMPLGKQVWGDSFGDLTDKFGIHWLVNISSGQAEQQG